MKDYFDALERDLEENYRIARTARQQRLDPSPEVEVFLAKNMAERVVGLISIVSPNIKETTIVDRIAEL